ncbi:MAG: hypothetical protein ABWY55_08835 [Microbacterium sp.]
MTSVMAGNPTVLMAAAEGCLRSADGIAAASDQLSRLAFGQQSRATDAVEGVAARLARDLATAHVRYVAAAQALRTYADELTGIQQSFRTAEADLGTGATAGAQAEQEIDRLTRTLETYEAANAPVSVVTQISDELRAWQVRSRSLTATLGEVEGLMRSAEQQLEAAAQRAIEAIDAGQEPETRVA